MPERRKGPGTAAAALVWDWSRTSAGLEDLVQEVLSTIVRVATVTSPAVESPDEEGTPRRANAGEEAAICDGCSVR